MNGAAIAFKSVMSISDFPDELLLKVFKYLKPQSLLETVCVSKTWSRVSRDSNLWREIIPTWKTISESDYTDLDIYITRMIRMCSDVSLFK